MESRWFLNKANPEYISYLSRSASISPLLARILINRGIKTVDEVRDFLNPAADNLSDPYDLPSMSAAVERIRSALARREIIFIHGDYDTDGVSASALLYEALTALGGDCRSFIPHRFLHGYGFNAEGVNKAKEAGAHLIITVDCGISSFEAVEFSHRKQIDVIITDHHEPTMNSGDNCPDAGPLIPDALAVINPKISSLSSSVRNLSGAGVALKLVQALHNNSIPPILPLFDLAALGTIADVVPVTGENRIIVHKGLQLISEGKRPGIRALLKVSGMENKKISTGRLSFTVIPRLNAAGRIDDANSVVNLLTTASAARADDIAGWLDRLNTERQQIEENLYQEALEKLKGRDISSAIILASDTWHQGVNGIVASRIAEQFYRPVFIFSVEDGIAKGSGRSIPSFDICTALSACRELLIGFGGHKQAAGARLKASDLDAFDKKFCYLFDAATNIERDPSITIDADVSLPEITMGMLKELSLLEPLGYGNPEPLLGTKNLEVISARIVGNNHIKMMLRSQSRSVDTIGFGLGDQFEKLNHSTSIDAVFTPAVNEWNGSRYLQLVIKAFRPAL